jgi:hypothetical protein
MLGARAREADGQNVRRDSHAVNFLALAGLIMAVLSPPAVAGESGAEAARLSETAETKPRLDSLSDDSVERITLARRAVEDGRLHEADDLLRSRLESSPDDEEAYGALLALWADREPPLDSEPRRATRAILPDSFIETHTGRFVVFSDADAAWTERQARHLERAHHQFQRFATRLDLKPLPIRHKLVCVLFARRDDYRRFAAEHDGLTDAAVAGYYSPRADRIVFYDPATNPSAARAEAHVESLQREVDQLAADARTAERLGDFDRAADLRRSHVQSGSAADRQAQRVSEFVDRVSTRTMIHEAAHQLLYHTRVQNPRVQYPLWLSEGLATSFETDDPENAFGPDHEFQPRRAAFDHLLERDQLVPLGALIRLSMLPDLGDDDAGAVYNQSYALVTWLARHRRTELSQYLTMLRREPAGRPDGERQARLFTAAFGDPSRLERTWLRAERARLAESATR